MTCVERENERMRKPKIKVTLKVTVHFESLWENKGHWESIASGSVWKYPVPDDGNVSLGRS